MTYDDTTSDASAAARVLFGPTSSPGGSGSRQGSDAARPSTRLAADPEKVEQGLVQLVLTLVELVRQLMERQAIRRLESGSLTEAQEEDLGVALMRLAEKMDELKEHFGLTDEDLNLQLGPLGNLL